MVPNVALPPAIPFTFQETVVSVVLVTVAVKVTWFPRITVPLVGVTVTPMEGGGGGGGELAPPPLQPEVHAPAVTKMLTAILAALNLFPLLCGKGRIPAEKQAKGQRGEGNRG
jgi:hypothetical protein